jgi:hypothetical protein
MPKCGNNSIDENVTGMDDKDGYFLLKIGGHPASKSNKGYRLYAYNIAKVVDVIASSLTSSPPSNDYMLSNALASWSLDHIDDDVIWVSIPTHGGNGMIAIQSQDIVIRIYSVPSYAPSSFLLPNISCSEAMKALHMVERKTNDKEGDCDEDENRDGVIGSKKLYELEPTGRYQRSLRDRNLTLRPRYDYDMNEVIMEWVTIALMSNEVGWTLTPLIALLLSYLL